MDNDITLASLINAGLVKKNELVKILGSGDFSLSIKLEAHAASKAAVEKIEKAGGSLTIIN